MLLGSTTILGDGDGGDETNPNLPKNRRVRLGVGVGVGGDIAACWGLCSIEVCPDCEPEPGCVLALPPAGGLLARFESEAERKALKRPLDFLWLPMLLQ